MGKIIKKIKDEMSINQVSNIYEAILYFLKFILVKHFLKTTAFILLIILLSFVLRLKTCETDFFEFEKEPTKLLPLIEKVN